MYSGLNMPIKINPFNDARLLLTLFLVIIAVFTVPGTAEGDEKCTSCTQISPPPPSPPPPCPPPPPPPALPPPPPSPKKPPTQYCPPPPAPPSSFLYITGPPGNLYPIDEDFNGAARDMVMRLPVLVGCGLMLGLLPNLW
ncbi:hypothetical protein F2P56_034979 [Juglans regia]|uniref:Wiskott-Aldrich syndrome protein family member 2-like n=2 Tax=Juglans regia TaxID=51240 RepID=A0A2I4HUW6_JUGRE|nr:wiskott-Aldrich syndrome protein family member 2-like [Juglans regia]KAF5442309.1 hypothetical protein F2P56_034979 [Juglans regia]